MGFAKKSAVISVKWCIIFNAFFSPEDGVADGVKSECWRVESFVVEVTSRKVCIIDVVSLKISAHQPITDVRLKVVLSKVKYEVFD